MISLYADLIENTGEEYDGLRVAAGTRWLEEIDLEAFMEYEGGSTSYSTRRTRRRSVSTTGPDSRRR